MALEDENMRVIRETIKRDMPQFLENRKRAAEVEQRMLCDPELREAMFRYWNFPDE